MKKPEKEGNGVISCIGLLFGTVARCIVLRNPTGNAIASGYVGETRPFTSRQTTGSTGAFVVNASPLDTLTAGVWIVYAKATFSCNNAASYVGGVVSTNNTADGSGRVADMALAYAQASSAANLTEAALVPLGTVTVSSSQALYAKSFSEDAAVNVIISGFSVRIA